MVLSLNLKDEANRNVFFNDVDSSHWSYDYVRVASNYLSGYTNGSQIYFKPDEQAVREDMALAIVMATNLQNKQYSLKTLDIFSDENSISESFKKYVAIAVENNLMRGNADGTFNPKGSLTRAEVSQLMLNTTKQLKNIAMVDENNLDKKQEEEIEELYKKMSLVPDGQVKQFAKKLEVGDFELQVNGHAIKGNLWKDKTLFELYLILDGTDFTDQFNLKNPESWTTMYGAKKYAELYGFNLEEIGTDKVEFTYNLNGKTYFAESEVDKTHVRTEILQNFICFVLNNDKSVKITLKQAVPDGQVKQFAKKLEVGDFELQVNGHAIKGNLWKDKTLFELYLILDGTDFTDQFNLKNPESWTTMYGAKKYAELYGFNLEEIGTDKVEFTYNLNGKTYFAESEVDKTHVRTEILQNFICFILNNDKSVKIY